MFCSKTIIFIIVLATMRTVAFQFAEPLSRFRILAPQFVCPKDEEAVLDKPDTTVITVQTSDPGLRIVWLVRWLPLVAPTTTQRFTLMVWRTVRALEKQLNKPQLDPNVYIIENSELLRGVNYVFNVTAVNEDGTVEQPKTFNIDNTQGDNKLMIEGRNDMLSIILVGAQTAFVDATFTIDAEVTTCYPTQDYYFSWSVSDVESTHMVDVSHIHGSKLEINPYSLKVDLIYSVNCKVIRQSNEDVITQTNLPFKVISRGLEVHLSVDYLVVSTNYYSFSIESLVISHDYYDTPLTYQWWCLYQGEDCNDVFDSPDNEMLTFPNGLPLLGEHLIFLKVTVLEQECTANATINTVVHYLPILQITPLKRQLNEGSEVNLFANSSNVAPTCSLSWFFADEENLQSYKDIDTNATCDECEHGQSLSDAVTIYSLEEQFLSELADYTNDTEWRQVTATMQAEAGRARFLAQCGCSLTFSCETLGTVYADLWLEINESPKVGKVTISPESGIALETIFRISTLAAMDEDTPLKYSFYCNVRDDEDLVLASYFEHRTVETILPFVAGGIEVWVEVCDSLGACSKGSTRTVLISPGDGRTVDSLIEDASAHARRCELDLLRKVAVSAVVTYTNTNQLPTLETFSEFLQKSLSIIHQSCIDRNTREYSELLLQLARLGIDTNNYIN